MAVHFRPYRTLGVVMTLKVSREKLWHCLTDSELLRQWYCQAPSRVTHAELDVRTGGRQVITVSEPLGGKTTVTEVFLEVIDGRNLVFTDAFDQAWIPSKKATKVTEITLEDVPDGTRLSLFVTFWDEADREAQEKGFDEGWREGINRLEVLSRSI